MLKRDLSACSLCDAIAEMPVIEEPAEKNFDIVYFFSISFSCALFPPLTASSHRFFSYFLFAPINWINLVSQTQSMTNSHSSNHLENFNINYSKRLFQCFYSHIQYIWLNRTCDNADIKINFSVDRLHCVI